MAALMEALRRPSITNEPPNASEQRRNDLLMIAVILLAIFLGWLIHNSTTGAVQRFALGGQLPSLAYPASWLEAPRDGVQFQAVDPASPSTFDARVEVFVRDVRAGETLDDISVSWPLRRNQELERFRSLSERVALGAGGQNVLILTYAYIADPTRESGHLGLPVVVQGQDLLFVANDGIGDRLVVVTVAADATEWSRYADAFAKIFASLGVQEGE